MYEPYPEPYPNMHACIPMGIPVQEDNYGFLAKAGDVEAKVCDRGIEQRDRFMLEVTKGGETEHYTAEEASVLHLDEFYPAAEASAVRRVIDKWIYGIAVEKS